jgi:hypothetical protein
MMFRRAFARACALVGSAVVIAAVLPAGSASAATMAITNVSPNSAINSGQKVVTFTTGNTYLPAQPPTVKVFRHGVATATSSGPNNLPTSGVTVAGSALPSNSVSVTINFAAANPGSYDVEIDGPSPDPQARVDTCTGCLDVFGFQPSVTSVSPSTLGEGTPLSVASNSSTYPGFQNFVINGQNFAKGYYEQCTLANCSPTGPNVAVRNHGTTTSDPNVALLDTVSTATGGASPTAGTANQIALRVNVTGTDATDYWDDVVVTNSDGKSATLPNALHILPRPTVDSIALAATGGSTIGRNATGQTLTLTGHDFLPTSTGISFIPPSVTNPPSTITFTQPPVISGDGTTITLSGVNATGVKQATGLGAWSVVVTDPTIHAASAGQALTVDDAPKAAPPVVYLDSTRTDGITPASQNSTANGQYYYGQGAQGVRFVVPVTGPFVAGTGTDGTTHTHVLFTSLPAGAHLVDETATTAPNVVTDTFDFDPGTTIGDVTFKLRNPDGGTSDNTCTNATNGDGVTTFPKENSCDLSIEAAPGITTIAGATEPAGTSAGSLTIFGANLHQNANNLVHVLISRGATNYVNGDYTATTVNGTQQVTVTGINVGIGETEGDADITVTNNDDKGVTVCAACFHVSSLTVTDVSPNGNTNDGSIGITITGKNYNSDATFVLEQIGVQTISPTGPVTVGQDPNSVNPADTVASATFDLTGAAPGFYDVVVTNPADPHQGSATLSHAFQVLANAPTASTVAPTALGGGATDVPVTMTGTNIFPGAQISFSSSSVTLDGDPVISPDHTTITQHVDIAPSAQSEVGTVKIVNTDGQTTATKTFTVDPAPVVNAIAPSSHANGTSFTMTITGSGFSTSPAPTVAFGNPHVSGSVTGVSNAGDSLTVSVQIGNGVATSTPASVPVTLTNSDSGVGHSPTDLTVNPLPTFGSTNPTTLPAGANVPQLQIFGTGFQPDAVVALDPQSAPGLTFGTPTPVSSTEVDVPVTVDSGAAAGVRTFNVTNGDGGAVPGTLTVITAPASPQTITATGGARSVTVQWAAPGDNGGSAITSYTVTLTKQGDPSTSASFTSDDGTARQHTFTTTDTPAASLANATTYVVQVLATNAAGNSAAAPTDGLTATTYSLPSAPASVTVSGGAQSITASWPASADAGGDPNGIASYTVTLLKQGDSPANTQSFTTPNGSVLSHTFTGLADNTTYDVTVSSTNAAGDSPTAATGSGKTATSAAAPTGVHVTPGDARATVTWTAPTNTGGAPITAYVVSATPGSHSVTTADGSTHVAVVTGLTNGTVYSFTVAARNGVGDGPPSAAVAGTPKFATHLGIATTKSLIAYGVKITLSGHLSRSNSTAIGGASVLVFRVPDVGRTQHIATVKTTSTGRWSYVYAPATNATYYVRYVGDAADAGTGSSKVRTNVAPVVRITSPANNSKSSVSSPLAIKGSVSPNKSGATVTLYYVDSKGALHKLASTKLTTTSTYGFSVKLGRGLWHLRVLIGATTNNVGARSAVLTVSRV